jgi:hypothetical protein
MMTEEIKKGKKKKTFYDNEITTAAGIIHPWTALGLGLCVCMGKAGQAVRRRGG